jgi:WD40 repeat protein/DNA-binding CsgD family transcriptional regulator
MNQPPALIESLTARELKILALISEGLSYGEIGQTLFLEKATVTWYVQQIYDKLGLEKSQRNHQKALAVAQGIGLLGSKPTTSTQEEARQPIKNPYKGLRSFQQGEVSEFFGRESLTQQLLSRLAENTPLSHFLAVVGPSGCGKSSVLHAGLIPALQQGKVEGSEQWVIATMIPGSHPLDELETALVRSCAKPGIEIMTQLQRDERGLQRLAGMFLPENKQLLLVIDQFEEVFSLAIDEDHSRRFLALLGSSVTEPHSRVRVVIALRADYYDRPLMSPAISELFRLRTEVVTPLSADELAQAICLPARQVGVQVESGLVAALVDEVSEHPGLLPLMQYSLTELFDRRQDETMTLAMYHQIGGIRGALTRRADVLYESLSTSQQALLRQIFLRLVKLGVEGEVLRRRVSRSELLELEVNSHVVDELIDQLAQYRLITLDYDPASGRAMVEIAHEALIREWDQLRSWLEDNREDIRQQRLLALAASDWREANRDPSYLLSGTHLIQFQTWAQDSPVELGPVEAEFLAISIHEKQRHDRQRSLIRNLVFGTVALVAIVMSGLSVIALDRERQARDAQTRAERRTLENHSIQLATSAQTAYAEGRTDLALLLAMKAVDMTEPPVLSDQIFRTIAQGPGIRAVLSTHISPVTTLAISPDKKMVISGGCASIETDMTCKRGVMIVLNIEGDVTDVTANQQIHGFDSSQLNGMVTDVVFNPVNTMDSQPTVLSACEDGGIILWEISPIANGSIIRRYDAYAGAAKEVTFSPNGKQFLAAYEDGMIILWDTATGREIERLQGGAGAMTSVAFSGDGRMAISASDDGTTLLWDVEHKTEIRRYPSPPGVWLTQVAFGPVNKYGRSTVWGLSSDNAISIWDLDSGQRIAGMPPGSNPYQDIAFTPDGETVALAYGGMILLNNPGLGDDEQRLMQISKAAGASITALATSTDNTLLVSGDEEGNLELWNLPVRDDLDTITVNAVTSLGHSVLFPDERHMLSTTGSADTITPSLVKIDLSNGEVVLRLSQLPGHVAMNALAIDPLGRYIMVGGGNSPAEDAGSRDKPFLWILDTQNGEIIHKLEGHQHNVKAVAISPDGRYALSGSVYNTPGSSVDDSGELLLWNVQSGQQVRSFANSSEIQGIAFSQDGKLAITCSQMGSNPSIKIWEIDTGKLLHRFPYGCLTAVFIQDGKSILLNAITASSLNRMVQIDTNSGEVQRRFDALTDSIENFAISLNEQYLFAVSQTTAFLWDLKSNQELSSFELPSAGANAWAVFPQDGEKTIIVQDNTKQLIEWQINELPTLANLQVWILKNRYLRQFTCEERILYEIHPYCNE